jgi:glycine dehydrogenase subunit 1
MNPVDDIPTELRRAEPPRLPPALTEMELTARLLELATPNTHLDEAVCFLGGGTWDHHVPAVVDAAAAAAGAAPVHPGASEGLLQLVLELQDLFACLVALDAALAPLPDGPSALVEAARTAARATGRREVVVARSASPWYRAVLRTRLAGPVREAGYHGGATRPDELSRLVSDETACLVVEHPNFFGCLEDVAALSAVAREAGALLVVKADPIALGVLESPGQQGADLVVADAQPLGTRPCYGSGAAGLLACRGGLLEATGSWRVVEDDGLWAVGEADTAMAADRVARPLAYLVAMGGEGLARAAMLSAQAAAETQRRLCGIDGIEARFRAPFFKEFVIESVADPADIAEELLDSNILGALPLQPHYPEMDHCMLFAATERRTATDIDMLCHSVELAASLDLDLE